MDSIDNKSILSHNTFKFLNLDVSLRLEENVQVWIINILNSFKWVLLIRNEKMEALGHRRAKVRQWKEEDQIEQKVDEKRGRGTIV